MHVTFNPKTTETGDPREWVFDPGEVYADEAELVEDHFRGTWSEFVMAVRQGKASALKLLFWYLMRRDHIDAGNRGPGPNLRDVPRFRMGEFQVHQSSAELQEARDAIEASAALTSEQRGLALEAADREIARALTRETNGPAAAGPPGRAAGPAVPPATPPTASGPQPGSIDWPGLRGATLPAAPPTVSWVPDGGSEPPATPQASQTTFEHVEPTAEIIRPPADPTVGEQAAEVDRGPLPEGSERSSDDTG